MTSLRKPVRLTIIGSDANSYNFLVKYGEDLRQDERVQQLLSLMNGIFTHHHLCRERHLSVATYKVRPAFFMFAFNGASCTCFLILIYCH